MILAARKQSFARSIALHFAYTWELDIVIVPIHVEVYLEEKRKEKDNHQASRTPRATMFAKV